MTITQRISQYNFLKVHFKVTKHHFNNEGNPNQTANNEKSYHTCWNSDSDLLWLALAILFMATNCKKICEVCHCLAMLNLDLRLKIRTKMKKKNVDNWAWLQTCDPEYLSASFPLIIDCTSSGLK